MKDPNEVLREKEEALARVRHEIQSLEIAASLLIDELTSEEPSLKKESAAARSLDSIRSAATGTNGLFSSVAAPRSSFWKVLKRKR